MQADLTQRIAAHPKYQELKAKRTAFGWWLSLAGMIAYYGFILLVAFDKPLLSTILLNGTTGAGAASPGLSLGILLGALVIVSAWVLTSIYVIWANNKYDHELHELAHLRG